MEPEIVEREAFTVLGVQERFAPGLEDFEGIWMRAFMARHQEIHPLSTDKAYYGVCFHVEGEDGMDYLAGMAVPADTACPEGLAAREVPAARDAVFECTVDTIHETYEHVHGPWVARAPYAFDWPKPSFEQYPPDTESGDSPVLIHVPIRDESPR